MSKKLCISLAPLVLVAAFVLPSVAQAAPHYYKNGSEITPGNKVPTLAWGKLSLTSSKGGTPVECENAVGGYVENPIGGGAGKSETNGWAAYNCHDEECELGGGKIGVIFENENSPGQALKLSWPGELVLVGSTIRDKSTNVRVYTHCQFLAEAPVERPGTGPFTGLEEKESKEFNAPGSTICTTASPGSSEAKVKNGTNAEKPSKTEFDAGAGQLECGTGGKGITGGTLKVVGFTETELIQTK